MAFRFYKARGKRAAVRRINRKIRRLKKLRRRIGHRM